MKTKWRIIELDNGDPWLTDGDFGCSPSDVPAAMGLVIDFLCDQELLKEPVRNEALCEKARKLLGEVPKNSDTN
jgi:hypothetical protein